MARKVQGTLKMFFNIFIKLTKAHTVNKVVIQYNCATKELGVRGGSQNSLNVFSINLNNGAVD